VLLVYMIDVCCVAYGRKGKLVDIYVMCCWRRLLLQVCRHLMLTKHMGLTYSHELGKGLARADSLGEARTVTFHEKHQPAYFAVCVAHALLATLSHHHIPSTTSSPPAQIPPVIISAARR